MLSRIARRVLLIGTIILLYATPALSAGIAGRVVGEKGEGIAQAIVFVQQLPAGATPAVGPRPAVMDQVHKAFVPALLPVVVGTEVRFPNYDQIHHHVYSFSDAKSFELPLYKGEEASPVLFDKVGVVKIGCNIHDWMSGTILVLPTAHYTLTDETGRFVLRDLPSGTYPLAAWHELSRVKVEDTIQQVQVDESARVVTFTLSLKTARSRTPVHGARGYR